MNKVISCIFAVAFIAVGSSQSQASVVLSAQEIGGNVVIDGSGTLNLTALTYLFAIPAAGSGTLGPADPQLLIGGPSASLDAYEGVVSGPSSIGPGLGPNVYSYATSNTGTAFGFDLRYPNWLMVSQGYVNNSLLIASSIFSGTFASLGLNVGSYVWTWGEGDSADSFTLNVGVAAVPVPAGLPLLAAGLGALGFAGWRKKRSAKTAVAVSA